MKTIYTSLLGLVLSIPMVIAQNAGVESYFDDGTKWTTIHYADYGCNGFTDICYVQGDTTIAEKTYQKILYTHNDNNSRVIPIIADGQKIYAHIDAKDVLLYDFGLEVGDSIKWYDYLGEGIVGPREYAYVTKVDTVTLLDGRKAKRLHYDCRLSDIEFIGCEYGILSPFVMPAITTCGGTNACCSMNGEPIFETTPGFCENILRLATTWYGIQYYHAYPQQDYKPEITGLTYYLQGDTIINATTYYKILFTHEAKMLTNAYRGAIRYSANKQHVYFVPAETSVEYLLYDYSVRQGDVVTAYDGFYDISCVELAQQNPDKNITPQWTVRQVETVDGRKHIQVEHDGNTIEWIEGVGTKYILWSRGRSCNATGMEIQFHHTLCAADSEGNILYSFNTDELGIRNNCPDWESTSIEEVKEDIPSGPAYDILGRPVDANYRGIVIQGGKKMVW